MIPDITKQQISALRFSGRPLVICDVDEVVLHFTSDFEAFLGERGLQLVPDSFALNGNVRERRSGKPIANRHLGQLLDLFFHERTLNMKPIAGAVPALLEFGRQADIVLLTNLPHTAGNLRRRNLESLGLPYPVITNSGAKGPAVLELAGLSGHGTTIFIDDSPQFIASAREHAPQVHLIHFLQDERFSRHLEPLDYVSLRSATWEETRRHVLQLIAKGM